MSDSMPRWRVFCAALAAWPYGACSAGGTAIRLDPADRHINTERGVYMLRVVVALLLVAAALAAVDLSGLVDVVYNTTSPLERFAPTYVFEVDGCKVLVYASDHILKNSPKRAHAESDSVYYSRNKTLRPLTSAEVEKLLGVLFQVLEPSVGTGVVIQTNSKLWCTKTYNGNLRVETIDVDQLVEEVRKTVETESAKDVAVFEPNSAWWCTRTYDEGLHVETVVSQPVENMRRNVETGSAKREIQRNFRFHCVKMPSEVPRVEVIDPDQLAEELRRALKTMSVIEVVVDGIDFTWRCTKKRYEFLDIESRNVTQLVGEARRAVEADFYLGAADALEALLKRGTEPAAYLYLVEWRRGDFIVYFFQDTSLVRLTVKMANLSAAVEALKKVKEVIGEAWNSVEVELWHVPYFVPDGAKEALTKAARMLEEEFGEVWNSKGGEGQEKWVRVFVEFSIDDMGPLYVIVPYPTGTAPDRATAERLVRRFVELSGFCKSPLVVEFWLWPRLEPPTMESSPPLWPYVAAVGTAFVAALGLVLTRRRK